MKKLLLLFALSVVSLQFFSCTDYEGSDPVNSEPIINVYDTSDIISNKKTKIQWYGNDIDGANLTYFYTVTTDITLDASNVLSTIPESSGLWNQTTKTFAYISMPYGPFPTTTTPVYADSTTYDIKVVPSRFFVFGVDENGARTKIVQKDFIRTNKRPKHPMVYSTKLGLNGFEEYWMTVGPDSAQMVLEKQTEFWKPFDFKWMGEDPDGPDVDLEFKWELWERTNPPKLVKASNGWSVNYLSVNFSKDIYDNNRQGKYSFKVYVRDDAFEESLNHATVNFEVFAPELNKGILVIDDTDADLFPPPSLNEMGNPDGSKVRDFYAGILEEAGYKPEGQATDSLHLYRIKKFTAGIDTMGYEYYFWDDDSDPSTPEVLDSLLLTRGVYKPDVRDLSSYRLVIILSDDRSNSKGVDFAGTPPFTGYNTYLSSYLDVGGNLMVAGNCVLMGKFYSSPPQLPVIEYKEPYRYVFDGYTVAGQNLGANTELFFNKYFGIYSMTFPEQKTYYTQITGTNTTQYRTDHFLADNYDFVGAEKYSHVSDAAFVELRIDSAKANGAFYNVPGTGGRIRAHALKDNGTVFTGIPTIECYKGEVLYKYKSIYDLTPKDANYSYEINGEDTLKHYLWNFNKVTNEVHSPVLRRSGTVATRYISPGSSFKTAFFTIPLYFFDDTNGDVSKMFKAMVEWFDINNGGSK
jgi:hypothetical protein